MNVNALRWPASASERVSARPGVRPLASVAAVASLVLLAFVAVRSTGGTPNALGHLAYLPIVAAAFAFGWRGGSATGLLMGALLGPLGAATGMHTEGLHGWLVRAVFFVGIGSVTGGLFDFVRSAAERWRQTATRVLERERDGVLALARGAEAKDTDTGEHIRRVQLTSEELAIAAGLEPNAAAQVGWAAMLHDVGKLHVPDSILLKPGRLLPEEWAVMRMHPTWGEEILCDGQGFELARRIARWHHENLDGSGYPDGLRGAQIPLEARIVRITDSFDAMTNRRPYAAPRSLDEAIEELRKCRGTMFDPELVDLMVALLEKDSLLARLAALRARPFPGDRPAPVVLPAS